MPQPTLRVLLLGQSWVGPNRTEHVLAFFGGFHPSRSVAVRVACGDALPWRSLSGSALLSLPSRLLFFAADLLRALRTDVIYVLPMNYSALDYAGLLKKLGRSRLVVDYYVAATSTLADAGGERCWIGTAAECRAYDRSALHESDVLIVPQRSEIAAVARALALPAPGKALEVLPLCCEDRGSHFTWSPGSRLRLAWWGAFTALHGAETVLQALADLGERRSGLHLTIIGLERNRAATVAEIGRLGLEQTVTFRTDLSFHDGSLPAYLTRDCDLALGHFGGSEKARNIVSNKIVEALSLGLPVLTGDGPGVREFLTDGEALMVEQTPAAIAGALRAILDGDRALGDLARAGKEAFHRTFSTQAFRRRMGEIVWERLWPEGVSLR